MTAVSKDDLATDREPETGAAVRARRVRAEEAVEYVSTRRGGDARSVVADRAPSRTGYVARRTGTGSAQTLLVRTDASPPVVAERIRTLLGPASGATVRDIQTQRRVTLSSLTAVDLHGLTRLELVYALAMAAACSGLVLAIGIGERRRSYAIASALGARTRHSPHSCGPRPRSSRWSGSPWGR
jgi:hypothetical protein